jgi:DnaJ-class molecular chaperone
MANPAKHKSVSVPKPAHIKAEWLADKIIPGTKLSISKVIESIINEKLQNTDTRMEKHKEICKKCNGNGFYSVPFELVRHEEYVQCEDCKSQGEIELHTPEQLREKGVL